MSSGDFNLLHLRNLKLYNPDGSFPAVSSIFVVGSQGVPVYTSSISLSGVTASTITTSTLNSSAQIGFSTMFGSSVTASSITVSSLNSSAQIGFSTMFGSSVTASSITVSSLNSSAQIGFSTMFGSSVTASSITVSSLNSSARIGFSTLVGSSISTLSATASSITVSSLNASAQISFSTMFGSSVTASSITVSSLNASAFLGFSTLVGSSISTLSATASSITVSTLNTSAFLGFSTLVGSSISTLSATASSITVSSLNSSARIGFSTLVGSSITTTSATASSITVSSLNASAQISFSTMFGSSVTASSITVSSLNTSAFLGFSTLVGSSITTTSATASSITVSSLNTSAFLGFSTLVGSSISTTSATASSITVSSLNSSAFLGFSTMFGSSVTASSITVSSLNSSAQIGFSTLVGSSISTLSATASSITVSTLNSSARIGFSTMVGSSITASTITVSTLNSSAFLGFSTMVGSSITASTITVSTLNASAQIGFSTLVGSTISTNSASMQSLTLNETEIALGLNAGLITQGTNSVAVGNSAGFINQGTYSIAIGSQAGNTTQGTNSVAIGTNAGSTSQGAYSVAVGSNTTVSQTNFSQGDYSATSWITAKTDLINPRKIGTSATGQYQLVVSGNTSDLWLSSDSGTNWTALTPASTGLPVLTGAAYWSSGSISANGQYILLGIYGGSLWFSCDFGRTFALTSQPTPTIWLQLNGNVNDAMGGAAATAFGSPAYVTVQHPGFSDRAINLANPAGGTATRYVRGAWTGAPNFTVSMWFNAQTVTGNQTFFSGYAQNLELYLTGSTLVAEFPSVTNINSTIAIVANTWYYVTLIFQTDGVCSFYVNNTLMGTRTNVGGPGANTTGLFGLGTYNNATSNAFNGYIADVKILNSAPAYNPIPLLNPNIWLPFENTTEDLGSQSANSTSSTIYLPFEGAVTDSMGVSTVTATGSPGYVAANRAGYTGQAINLANTAGGTATRYVRGTWTPPNPVNFSVSFWFNPQTVSGVQQQLFGVYGGSAAIGILSSNQLVFAMPTGGGTGTATVGTTSYTLSINTWYYVTAIFQTGGTCSFYVNNALIGTATNTSGVGTLTTSLFGLGCNDNSTAVAFNGYIDDFRIYNYAIAYNPVSIQTVTGSLSYVPGVIGLNAVNLVNTAGGTAVNYIDMAWSTTPNFTISFWFNIQSLGGSNELISADTNGFLEAWVTSSNTLSVQIPSNSTQIGFPNTGALSLNTWYHFYLIFQTGGTCSLYLNGALVGNLTNVNGTTGTSWTGLLLGRERATNASAFNGYIDDFRLYNAVIPFNAASILLPQNYRSVAVCGTGQYALASAASGWVVGSTTTGQTWEKEAVCVGTQGDVIQPNKTGLAQAQWEQNGVNWVSSASSAFTASYTASNGFNNNTLGNNTWAGAGIYNASGTYIGSVSTTITTIGSVTGEWLQIQSSIPLVLQSYTYGSGGTVSQLPKTYYIVGSMDGSTWYPLQYVVMTTNPSTVIHTNCTSNIIVNTTGSFNILGGTTGLGTSTVYSYTTQPWIYVRLIVVSIYTGPPTQYAEIGELYLNFAKPSPTALSLSYSGQYQMVAANSAAGNVMPNQTGLATSTWTQGGVQWGASSSPNSTSPALLAFNNNSLTANNWLGQLPGTYSATGAYTGSVTTTIQGGVGPIGGEWVQIQASVPLMLSSYSYGVGTYQGQPKTMYIVGSMDGSIWYPLQLHVLATNPFTTNFTVAATYITMNTTGTQTVTAGTSATLTTTAYSYTTQPFMYFRFIINTNFLTSVDCGTFGELYLNFQNSFSYSTNYGSTWLNSSRTLSNEIVALSPSGQYALSTNCVAPLARLTLDNTNVDAQGVLVPATGAGTVTYSTSIVKVGTHSAFFNNTAGAAPTNYLNYTVPAVLNTPTMMTMSCWIYPTGYGSTTTPLSLTNGTTTMGPYLYFREANMGMTFNVNGGATQYAFTSPGPSLNTWTHLCATYNGSAMTFYANGVSLATTNAVGNLTLTTGAAITNVFIGTLVNNGFAFAGYVDDVRLYTTALSADEVLSLYNNPAITQSIGVSNSYLPIASYTEPILPGVTANVVDAKVSQTGQYMVAVTSGANSELLPLGRLTLDNTNVDARGVFTSATGLGTVTYSSSIKQVGTHSALFSNTVNTTPTVYLSYAMPVSLYQPSRLTLACWIYPLARGTTATFLALNQNTTTQSHTFYVDGSGVLNYAWATGSNTLGTNLSTGTVVPLSTWSHVVMTYTSGLMLIYLNGVLVGTDTRPTGNLCQFSGGNLSHLMLGARSTNINPYNGYIDDVRIHDVNLSATQVSELYTTNAAINRVNNVYYSTNYGSTFNALSIGSSSMTACSVSYDGSYLTASNATGTIYTLNKNATGYTLALGNQAGQINQAQNAIAIGNQAGQINQSANSIVLNASGSALNSTAPGFYVAPIGGTSGLPMELLGYGSDSQVVKSGVRVLPGATSLGPVVMTLDVGGVMANPYIGRSNIVGSVHDADKRDSVWFGRLDGTNAVGGPLRNAEFLGMRCVVDTAANCGYGVNDNQTYLGFHTWGNSMSLSREVMRIRGDGRVGIGTTTPSATLDINGSIAASTDLVAQGAYLTPSTTNAAMITRWLTRTINTVAQTIGTPPFWGGTLGPSAYSTIAGAPGSNAYIGGVLLPDGRVVFVPTNATTIGLFNPATNTFSTITPSPALPGNYAYVGGVLLPDGRVVFVPHNATTIGIFNPATNTFSTIAGAPGGGAYWGGVLLPDGRVVFVPYNATTIGIFNPATNTFSTIPGAPGSNAYFGGVLLPDGRVVFVPLNATTIGLFNPTTNTYSTIAGAPGSGAYIGGVLLPDGRVVFVPYAATTIGLFNPTTNTFSTIAGMPGSSAYAGGVLLPDGRVVFVPFSATTIGLFNPATNTFSTITPASPALPGNSAYAGGVLLPDGRVVFVPSAATTVGLLYNHIPASKELCLHPFFNKF